jgi:hypothetical protein
MQIFGGLITTNPTDPNYAKLNATDYGRSGYYANNFNDMWSGFVTLFELLVANNWFVLVDGFQAVTGVSSRFFFVSFYVLGESYEEESGVSYVLRESQESGVSYVLPESQESGVFFHSFSERDLYVCSVFDRCARQLKYYCCIGAGHFQPRGE